MDTRTDEYTNMPGLQVFWLALFSAHQSFLLLVAIALQEMYQLNQIVDFILQLTELSNPQYKPTIDYFITSFKHMLAMSLSKISRI